jgi:TolB-like protein/DNA-binding winged helix-turn-helix (wHTH) protein
MTQPFRFDRTELRPAERQLTIDGRPVVIGARAFDVLHLLIRHRDRVVSKNELLEAVWPGLVVEENNLQVQISTLRKLLGAAAITTVPAQGYQFTAALDSERGSEPAIRMSAEQGTAPRAPSEHVRHGARLAVALGIVLVIATGIWSLLRAKSEAMTHVANSSPPAPTHSVAVLPFVNMSGDPTQDYFSDGLSEELLNSLASIPELRVAARTSSFSFKGRAARVADIGRELNVGAVLEGSVRKDGRSVRITVQLVDVASGFELWSHAYDRDLKNILALQTEIAASVNQALQATLLPDAASTVELGGTSNPQAFDAYLQAEMLQGRTDKESVLARIAAYDEAIRQDPNFAKAYVGEADSLSDFAESLASSLSVHNYYAKARAAAEKAVALAPELGRAHSVMAQVLAFGFFDFTQSRVEYERAVALSPGDSFVLQSSVCPLVFAGRTDTAVANAKRAVALDPINAMSHAALGFALYFDHQYREAIEAFNRARILNPNLGYVAAFRGLSYKRLGDIDAAPQSCSTAPIDLYNSVCLAIVYHQQNRVSEAQAEVEKLMQNLGDAAAYQYVEIYAQWGDVSSALRWLETAYRLRDAGLVSLEKDELMDPLRNEPRFQKIERQLNFPN